MNRFIKLITHIFKNEIKESKPLGRWNIDYCYNKINNKVDLSNEDHCGPCGQYILSKDKSKFQDNYQYKNTN